MPRLSEIFSKNKRCFIPFVTAGHPDLDSTRQIVLHLAQAGSDIIEIGIPFSDPIADGPIIQESSFHALRHAYALPDYIGLVKDLRKETDVGLIFMSYMNPVWKYGLERLHTEASAAGLDGILISDLPPEEHLRLQSAGSTSLDSIFLAAPTSSDDRLRSIAAASSGFIYLVARTGVTGKQSDVQAAGPSTARRIRSFSQLPLAVGFGVKSANDVRKIWQYAEGAVVGSAIVRFITEHQEQADLPSKVGQFVKDHLIPNE